MAASSHPSPLSIGFVGVGAIASDVITAVLGGAGGDGVSVVLSPRSAARSAALAERFAQARVADSNQAVVDASDIVFLAMLPGQVEEVCASLTFRAEQIVVSLAAGWPPSSLKAHVAPASRVCQMIPLPMITLGVGPVVLHPAFPEVERLLQGCGVVVEVEKEEDILTFSCMSATMSQFFETQNVIINWATQHHGIDPQQATDYITTMFHGLATHSFGKSADAMPQMTVENETPGGLNEHIRKGLMQDGFGESMSRHLEHIYQTRRMDSAE